MINRKTKRNSPPPTQMTIATMDTKLTDKWSRMLQLISPPNKIRRATTLLIGQEESDDEKEEINDDSGDDSYDEEEEDNTVKPTKRESCPSNKQKLLRRRGMYISTPSLAAAPVVKQQQQQQDGPKDARHKWALYRATHHKLRRNSLPLREGLHLKKMFDIFQKDEIILQQESISCFDMEFPPRRTAYQCPLILLNKNLGVNHDDEEDNIPLGTLFEKTKRQTPSVLSNMSRHAAHKQRQTYTTNSDSRPQSPSPNNSNRSIKNTKPVSLPMSRPLAPPTPVHFIPSSNYHYRNAASSFLQPYYYYHSNHGHSPKQSYPVQFI